MLKNGHIHQKEVEICRRKEEEIIYQEEMKEMIEDQSD